MEASMDGNRPYSYNGGVHPDREQEANELVSVEQLRRLVQLLDRSDVSELEVKRAGEGMRLVLRKAKMPEHVEQGSSGLSIPLTTSSEAATATETKQQIVAPLVGIFHSWAKPKGGALVAIGDMVKVGQLVATIQSLNVINEVESSLEGRVVEILVQDGQPVEYGQPLITLDTREGA
jgi:acetyl-CoA carboxylase biotin carboxyl carrier protein